MSQHDGNEFGGIHIAATAESNQQIGFEMFCRLGRLPNDLHRWFRNAAIERFDECSRLGKRFDNPFENPRLDQNCVGNDEHSLSFHSFGDVAELRDRTPAKNERAGRMKGPRWH